MAKPLWVFLFLFAPLMGACQQNERPAAAASPAQEAVPPATMTADLRKQLEALYPLEVFGEVTMTTDDLSIAKVQALRQNGKVVDPGRFTGGEVISIIGPQGRHVCTGAVLRATRDALHVGHFDVVAGGRLPQPGDVAVRYHR